MNVTQQIKHFTARLLDALMAYARRFSQHIGYAFHQGSIRLTAYTGCAATEIGGDTTSRSFKLASTRDYAINADLEEFRDMRMVVVDEVSFLDHDRELRKLSDRLQSFTQCQEYKYGRCPIVFLGDFRQLAPVSGTSILLSPKSLFWEHAISCMVELKGTHRFDECPTMKRIMPRLHQKGLSEEDRAILNTRVIDGDNVKYPNLEEARIASFYNTTRCNHNRHVFREYLKAHHSDSENTNIPRSAIVIKSKVYWGKSTQELPPVFRKVLFEYCPDAMNSSDRNEKCDPFLTLIHGAPVMGTKNKDVSHGVAKGTCATFERLICKAGHAPYPMKLHGRWVYGIDIENVDSLVLKWTDSKFEGTFKVKPESGLFKTKFPVWNDNGNMHRSLQSITIIHFPIILNYGTTGHKLQGKSLDCLVITEWSRLENWAYVVLSRVRTLKGLYLTAPIPDDIDFDPSPHYLSMMAKLRNKQARPIDIDDLRSTTEYQWIVSQFEAFA